MRLDGVEDGRKWLSDEGRAAEQRMVHSKAMEDARLSDEGRAAEQRRAHGNVFTDSCVSQ